MTATQNEIIAALCIWEEMLARHTMLDGVEWAAPMLAKWEKVGTCEMRDDAFRLGKLINDSWEILTPEQQEDCGAFDWEFVPLALSFVDWDDLTAVGAVELARRVVGTKKPATPKFKVSVTQVFRVERVATIEVEAEDMDSALYAVSSGDVDLPEYDSSAWAEAYELQNEQNEAAE